MIREEVISYDEISDTIANLVWLPSDVDEAMKLTGKTIPQLFKRLQKNFLEVSVIYNDDKIISVIALDFSNVLTYFNTVDVKECLKNYLKFLKQLVEKYVEERSYLTVWSLKSYTTTTKKLKYLGFRQSVREFRRIKWVARQTQ